MAKHLKMMSPSQKISNKEYQSYFPIYMHFFLSAGEGEVPQDMRDAKIVTLFKNKGDRRDFNNYR